jgi:hypothetical protein
MHTHELPQLAVFRHDTEPPMPEPPTMPPEIWNRLRRVIVRTAFVIVLAIAVGYAVSSYLSALPKGASHVVPFRGR